MECALRHLFIATQYLLAKSDMKDVEMVPAEYLKTIALELGIPVQNQEVLDVQRMDLVWKNLQIALIYPVAHLKPQ